MRLWDTADSTLTAVLGAASELCCSFHSLALRVPTEYLLPGITAHFKENLVKNCCFASTELYDERPDCDSKVILMHMAPSPGRLE